MPVEPGGSPRGAVDKPVNADAAWDRMIHTMRVVVPARLHYTERAVRRIRKLRGKR